jgi:hypothetical protein
MIIAVMDSATTVITANAFRRMELDIDGPPLVVYPNADRATAVT